jgi:chemotaxis protein MotB
MDTPLPPARPKKKENHERWVISYADLLTLLLAFFVVLYASSTRDKFKMRRRAC